MRFTLLLFALATCLTIHAQTYFYIQEMAVVPQQPTTSDNVTLQLIGSFSDTGGYFELVQATLNGNTIELTIIANSPGGADVLVPHTEEIELGQLPAGTYSVSLTSECIGVVFLPSPEPPPFAFTVNEGGGSCEGLELISLQWQAFADTALVVHVTNASTELFDYPNFILLDAEGDTLAVETVELFGIGEESHHVLHIMEGVIVPQMSFNGRLELWTGFTSELACVWEQEFDLCPPEDCLELHPTLANSGGASVIGIYDWQIYDEDFLVIAEGQFELTLEEQMADTTLCLPPGDYHWNVFPQAPGQLGQPVFFITVPGQSTATTPAAPSLPMLVPFTFYGPCISGANAIEESQPRPFIATPAAGGVSIQRTDGGVLGPITVFDPQGRMVFHSVVPTDRAFVPVATPGIYLLRAGERSLRFVGGMY